MYEKSVASDYRATPYLICRDASSAIDWYQRAFDAVEVVRMADPSGKIMHSEIRIGNAPIMLADEFPDMGYKSPQEIGGSAVSIHVLLSDVDRSLSRAVSAGAKELMGVSDQFDGERRATVVDPYGHTWLLAQKLEEIPFAEMLDRFEEMMSGEA